MSSFILLFSILIIIVSICLIIFNRDATLSNMSNENDVSEDKNSADTEHNKHDNFEKIFLNKTESVSYLEGLHVDNNTIDINSCNDEFIKKPEVEDVKSDFNEKNDIDNIVKKIYKLRAMGLGNQEIAKELGKGVREIDIILKINKLKTTSDS